MISIAEDDILRNYSKEGVGLDLMLESLCSLTEQANIIGKWNSLRPIGPADRPTRSFNRTTLNSFKSHISK